MTKKLALFLRRFADALDGATPNTAIRPLWYTKQGLTALPEQFMWPSDATVWVGPFLIHEPGSWPRTGWSTDADEVHYIHGYPIFYYKHGEDWRERDRVIRRETASRRPPSK